MDCVVAELDQRYAPAVLEVNVTDPPAQKDVGPLAVTVGAAIVLLTVTTVAGEVAFTPLVLVTRTV